MFVALIAALSLVGSVVILAADKERDCDMLRARGGTTRMLRRSFTWEGVLITSVGVAVGVLLGTGFAGLQEQFGLIRMNGEAFLMEAYPVRIEALDLAAVAVLLLGGAISAATAAGVTKQAKE